MKLSKEELKAKYNEMIQDNEVAIALLEDIEDSFESGEVDTSAMDELQAKFDDLQRKYRERFLSVEEKDVVEEEEKTEDEELKEEEVIDVKEI